MWSHLIEWGQRGTVTSIILVPVHVENLLAAHRQQATQDAFLREGVWRLTVTLNPPFIVVIVI